MTDAVLLDWDGTLVDTRAALLATWHAVTTEVLGRRFPVTEADRRRFLSMRGADSFPLLSDDAAVVSRLSTRFTQTYLELAPGLVRAHAGAEDWLAGLRSAGVRTAVVTSKTAARLHGDDALVGLLSDVDTVVTGDDVRAAKPDPEAITTALTRLGVRAARAVVVGDGPVDVRAGRAAGAATVAVSHGLHTVDELGPEHPDALVDDLSQAAAAAARLLSRHPETSD